MVLHTCRSFAVVEDSQLKIKCNTEKDAHGKLNHRNAGNNLFTFSLVYSTIKDIKYRKNFTNFANACHSPSVKFTTLPVG